MDINLEGLGVIREFSYKNGRLFLTIALEGLQDHPISIEAKDIEIAPDGSSVTVKSLMSNMPFAHNALNRFASGTFEVPESARAYFKSANAFWGCKILCAYFSMGTLSNRVLNQSTCHERH